MWSRIAKTISIKKHKMRGIIIIDINAYCVATIIKKSVILEER